jgi:hypothetical protein
LISESSNNLSDLLDVALLGIDPLGVK